MVKNNLFSSHQNADIFLLIFVDLFHYLYEELIQLHICTCFLFGIVYYSISTTLVAAPKSLNNGSICRHPAVWSTISPRMISCSPCALSSLMPCYMSVYSFCCWRSFIFSLFIVAQCSWRSMAWISYRIVISLWSRMLSIVYPLKYVPFDFLQHQICSSWISKR